MKPTAGVRSTPAAEFINASRTLLTHDYLPKLLKCTAVLSGEDLWWRPNESSNSIGNLLLHVCGNLREWIIGGAGGESIARDREAEFAARESMSTDELMAEVQRTLQEVDRVLANLREKTLLEQIEVQGFQVTRLHAVYHSVEHFSYHLGQIAYVTKLRTGRDLEIIP